MRTRNEPRSAMKIGILHGREETFPPALQQEIAARGGEAEPLVLDGLLPQTKAEYSLIVDRISHKVPFYRSYLKQQALLGTHCIHDPFWLETVDRAVVYQLAAEAQVPALPSVVLPSKDHPPGIEADDLQNLTYPLAWDRMLELVKLPAQLRSRELGKREAIPIPSIDALWEAYGKTAAEIMVLEGRPDPDSPFIALMAGHETVALGWDSQNQKYRHSARVESALAERAGELTRKFCRHARLPLVGVEWSHYGGRLVLSDLYLFPDLDWWSLSEEAFTRVVSSFTDYLLELLTKKMKSAGKRTPVGSGR